METPRQKKLNHAADFLQQGLDMLLIVHATNSHRPHIRAVMLNLVDTNATHGRQDEALGILERNTDARETGMVRRRFWQIQNDEDKG